MLGQDASPDAIGGTERALRFRPTALRPVFRLDHVRCARRFRPVAHHAAECGFRHPAVHSGHRRAFDPRDCPGGARRRGHQHAACRPTRAWARGRRCQPDWHHGTQLHARHLAHLRLFRGTRLVAEHGLDTMVFGGARAPEAHDPAGTHAFRLLLRCLQHRLSSGVPRRGKATVHSGSARERHFALARRVPACASQCDLCR